MTVIVYRYNSICEPGYIDAFRALGLTVVECRQDRELRDATLERKMTALAELIAVHRPLFVFSINYFPFISMVCDRFHAIYTSVSVDCPVFEIYDVTIRNACNRVFLFDRAQYLSIRDENPAGIFHLSLGADVDRIEAAIGPFAEFENNETYDRDVAFVGSLYNEKDAWAGLTMAPDRRARMEELLDEQQPIPGLDLLEKKLTDADVTAFRGADPAFRPSERSVRDISRCFTVDHYLSDHLTSRDRVDLLNTLSSHLDAGQVHLFTQSETGELNGVVCHGGVNSTTEMPLIFRRSRINLNPTMRAIRTGLPQRIWDVLGSGGFLLSNAQAEIPEQLQIGRHLDVYEDPAELVEKVRYWLSHEDERKEVARAGYHEVREKHLILHRVAEMIGRMTDTGSKKE